MKCQQCGRPEREHLPLASPSGGDFYGQTWLICPTAIYTPKPPEKTR